MTAIARFDQKITGYIFFYTCSNCKDIHVQINLNGLTPNTVHGLHVHEYGDISGGCNKLGGHYDPYKKQHGSVYNKFPNERHAGDLINNVTANKFGNVMATFTDNLIKGTKELIGKSIVIHQHADDLGRGFNKESRTTGNAGERIACALITIY